MQNANAYFDPDDHLDDDDDNIDYDNENGSTARNSLVSPRTQPQVWKDSAGHLVLYPPQDHTAIQV